MTRLKLIGYIAAGIVLILLVLDNYRMRGKIDDLSSYKSMYEVEHSENKIYRHRDSTMHNQSQVAKISVGEAEYIKELKDLNKKFDGVNKRMNNLENYSKVTTETIITKTVKIKDTIIYNADSIPMSGKTGSFSNKWTDATGTIVGDSLILDIKNREEMESVMYWDRKWFLGKKHWESDVRSLNPNTTITSQRVIKIERKKGLWFR